MSERNRGARHHRNKHRRVPLREIGIITGGLGLLTGCTTQIRAVTEAKVINGLTTIPINGVPQDIGTTLSPDCTDIVITEGSDRAYITISPDFRSVTVSPASGVEGPISGEATVGRKDWLGSCSEDATIPFSGYIDTKPTNCAQTAIEGNNAIVQCDGPGNIYEQISGQPLASIQGGRAVVPLDANREREIQIVDNANNTSAASLTAPTNCTQVPGELRLNPATLHAEVGVACDGKGMIYSPDGTTQEISGNHAWVGIPPGQPGQETVARVNHRGWETQVLTKLPEIAPPAAQVSPLRIERGKVVSEVTCRTTLGDPCTVYVGQASVQTTGDGISSSQIGFVEAVGDQSPALMAHIDACDSLGNCAPVGDIPIPSYTPFAGDTVSARPGETSKSLIVEINHPDPQQNLVAFPPPIRVTQETPMKSVPWAQKILGWISGTNDAKCISTQHQRDTTIFSCELPYSHGRVDVLTGVQELNGAVMPLTTSVGIPDYPPEFQRAVEATPYAFGLFVIGIIAIEAWLLARGYKQKRREENIREAQAVLNAHGFNQSPETLARVEKTISKLHDPRGREMASIWRQRKILAEIYEQHERRTRTDYRSTDERDAAFSTQPLQIYLREFNNQNVEQTVKNGYQGFVVECARVGERLLIELDDILRRNFSEGPPGRFHIKKDALVREDLFELLTMLYSTDEKGWFWKRVADSERDYRNPQRRGNSQIRLSSLTRDNMEKILISIASAQGLLQRKWGSKLYRMFKSKRGKGEKTPTFEDAQKIQDKLQII